MTIRRFPGSDPPTPEEISRVESLPVELPWNAGLPAAEAAESLPYDVPVAIVGAGITGSAAALTLARRGVTVAVLDRRAIAEGATGRSAGLLALGGGTLYARAVRSLGREKARDLWRFTEENRQALEALAAESKLAFGYEGSGSLWLAHSEEERDEALRSIDLLQEDGFESSWWEEDRAAAAIGSDAFHGAIHRAADAVCDPARLNAAIASLAARAGAIFVHGVDVREAEETEEGVSLDTDRGRVRSEMLLLCGDALVARLDPFFHDTVTPAAAQMMQTAPVEGGFEIPFVTHFGHELARRGPDGSILVGGMRWALPDFGVGRRSERPLPELTARLARFLRETFPRLGDARPVRHWGGLLGLSCDGLPFVGPIPGRPRLLVAAGYGGRGLAMGYLAGRMLGQMVVGDPVPEEWTRHFSPRRMV